jgi:hypothetical protein
MKQQKQKDRTTSASLFGLQPSVFNLSFPFGLQPSVFNLSFSFNLQPVSPKGT